MWRRTTLILTLLACALVAVVLPASASAGTYWWSADSNLMTPANGFHWGGDSARMNYWANRCEARSGTTYNVGTGCSLSWYPPANLDPTAGNWQGTHRSSSGQFRVVRTVEGNGTTVVQSSSTAASYNREWADMASYIRMTFEATANHTISTGTAQFATMDAFAIALVDPHVPGLNILGGHEGWKGPGGACIRYGYGEAGSGLQATALVNASTGAVHDNPSYASANITTGVFQNDRNCVSVAALPTGHYTFRASAVDKSGNGVNNDFVVSFDTTAPALSDISSGGTAVANGREFRGSQSGGYRPTFSVTSNDAHSGLSVVQVFVDGAHVANSGTYTPAANLTLGSHTIRFRAVDAVGNEANVTRTFTIIDDVMPVVTVAEPVANGSNEPILDVSATDDFSGVNAASWSVTVNGVQMPVSGTTRLQASLGRLANGTHAIVVRVRDHSGNQRAHTIQHVASRDTHTAPGLTGIYVLASPASVMEGASYHLLALAVKDGRPVGTGRFEVTRTGSPTVVAGKVAAADGSVDMLIEDATEGPMQLALAGSGLTPASFSYVFHAKGTPPFCTAHPEDASCRTTTTGGGGDGGNGGGSTTDGSTGTTGTGTTGTGTGTGTTGTGTSGGDTGTSGGPNDKVPPKVTLKAAPTKKGVVLRTKRLTLRITSNERANYTVHPIGNRAATKVAMKKQTRVLRIKLTGALLKRIHRAKTPFVSVKVRIVGIDGNKNVTRKTITLRIRR